MTVQDLVAAQRHRLADQLDEMTPLDWDRATLCDGWTVRHVVAHLTMPFQYSTARIALGMVLARGDFNRFADRVARHDASLPTRELARRLRDNADHPWRPPRAGFEAPLTDLVVHSLDILRPLQLRADIDPAALTVVLEHLVTPRSLEFFHVDLDGLALRASDVDWSHGEGHSVVGSSTDLVLALAQRATPLVLTGTGVGQLVASPR